MKNIILLSVLISSFSFGQTKTSVQDGNFFALTTWDCFCLPGNGDTLQVNHSLTMNAGIPYSAGQITIGNTGSLTDNGIDKDIYINGGSFINHGTIDLDGFWLDSGYVENTGTMNLDSLLTQDFFDNNGSITVFDFVHDQGVSFENDGMLTVTNNFNNQGNFINWQTMTVANDATNCNIQTSSATLWNYGDICVFGDFSNCGGDTLKGSGTYYIDGLSSNFGHVAGTLVINTSSAAFNVNTGTLATTITFGTATCGLSLTENESNLYFYPNPAQDIIHLYETIVEYTIYDLSGRIVSKGNSAANSIDISQINPGKYIIELIGQNEHTSIQKFVKF